MKTVLKSVKSVTVYKKDEISSLGETSLILILAANIKNRIKCKRKKNTRKMCLYMYTTDLESLVSISLITFCYASPVKGT